MLLIPEMEKVGEGLPELAEIADSFKNNSGLSESERPLLFLPYGMRG